MKTRLVAGLSSIDISTDRFFFEIPTKLHQVLFQLRTLYIQLAKFSFDTNMASIKEIHRKLVLLNEKKSMYFKISRDNAEYEKRSHKKRKDEYAEADAKRMSKEELAT